MILLATGGNNGGGYHASKYAVIGFHGSILLIHAILNSLPITLLSLFGQIAAAWNIMGKDFQFPCFLALIVIYDLVHLLLFSGFLRCLFAYDHHTYCCHERASAEFVFTHFNTENDVGIHSKLYIFVLGLLMSQYTLTGYDASVHMVIIFLCYIVKLA